MAFAPNSSTSVYVRATAEPPTSIFERWVVSFPWAWRTAKGAIRALGVARSVIERATGTSMKLGAAVVVARVKTGELLRPGRSRPERDSHQVPRRKIESPHRRPSPRLGARELSEVPAWGLLASAPRAGRRVHRIRIGPSED
jgi:ribosomal protein L15E